MARRPKTDVPNFFYFDPRNIAERLADFLGDIPGKDEPWTIRGTFKKPRERSEIEVFKEQGRGGQPEQITPILSKCESDLYGIVGPNPEGQLRVRIWRKGSGSNPQVNMQATLAAFADESMSGQAVTLKWILERQTRQENQALAILVQVTTLLQAQNASLHGLVEKLGTQRAAASTMADAAPGSVWQIVGGLALVMGWPAIKKAFGAPESATVAEVITMAQAQMLRAQEGGFSQLQDTDRVPRPPPGSGFDEEDDYDDGPDDDGPDDDGPDDDPDAPPQLEDHADRDGVDMGRLLEQLKTDPQARDALIAGIKSDPELLAAAMGASK